MASAKTPAKTKRASAKKARVLDQVSSKRCTVCEITKPTMEFYRSPTTRDGFAYRCKGCVRNRGIERRRTEQDRLREVRRKSRFPSKYGITFGQVVEMYESRGGTCDCCGKKMAPIGTWPSRGISPCIDHDHATDAIRGMLCQLCNTGAVAYLERHAGRTIATISSEPSAN